MQNETNLNQILQKIPHGTVVTASWLKKQGVSGSLQHAYKKNGWLKSFETGAYTKLNDTVEMDGAIYALQNQLEQNFHLGGVSALSKHGINHNLNFNRKTFIFGKNGEKLPRWFKAKYENEIDVTKTSFLSSEIGMEILDKKDFTIQISTNERAILEAIYLAPNKNSLYEIYQLLEMLSTLKPKLMQELLENCSNIKVKRVFLYMAEKLNYPWFKKLDLSKISLGSGKRVVEKGGKLDKKYNIVIGNIEEI